MGEAQWILFHTFSFCKCLCGSFSLPGPN